MTNIGKSRILSNLNVPRHLTGYALTERLESDPAFIALLTMVKGGNEQLPSYIHLRMKEQENRRVRK